MVMYNDTGEKTTVQPKTTKYKEKEAFRTSGAVGFLSFVDGEKQTEGGSISIEANNLVFLLHLRF